MTRVRADPLGTASWGESLLQVPAQAGDPALVRWIGMGFVGVLVLAVLAWVVWYGSERDRSGSDDSGRVFNPGPAYGLTGTADVEEVLRIDDPEAEGDGGGEAGGATPTGSDGSGGATDRAGGDDRGQSRRSESGSGTGSTASGDGAPGEDAGSDDAEFTHDVRERDEEEWLVEVTDGDRSARFRVGRVGSVLTVDPVASPAQRHGSSWVLRAERYLRDQELAVATERE